MTWDPIHNYCSTCGQPRNAEDAQDCPEPDCSVKHAVAEITGQRSSTVWVWTDDATEADWEACRRGELTIVDPGPAIPY